MLWLLEKRRVRELVGVDRRALFLVCQGELEIAAGLPRRGLHVIVGIYFARSWAINRWPAGSWGVRCVVGFQLRVVQRLPRASWTLPRRQSKTRVSLALRRMGGDVFVHCIPIAVDLPSAKSSQPTLRPPPPLPGLSRSTLCSHPRRRPNPPARRTDHSLHCPCPEDARHPLLAKHAVRGRDCWPLAPCTPMHRPLNLVVSTHPRDAAL